MLYSTWAQIRNVFEINSSQNFIILINFDVLDILVQQYNNEMTLISNEMPNNGKYLTK